MRALIVLFLLVPIAAAQHAHDESSGIVLVADQLETFVGSPATFTVLHLGDDNVPDFHQDIRLRAFLNDKLVFDQTPPSGHDYDGIATQLIAFGETGTYRVEAMNGETVAAMLEGPVKAAHETPILVSPLQGGLLLNENSFALIEERNARRILLTTLSGPGAVTMNSTFETLVTAAIFGNGVPAHSMFVSNPTGIDPRSEPLMPPLNRNDVTLVDAPPYTVVASFDPYTVVGPQTLVRLTALVMDEAGMPTTNISATVTLRGPEGIRFESSSFFAPDGIIELEFLPGLVGQYTMTTAVTRGDWSSEITHVLSVIPAVEARSVGRQTVTFDGPTKVVAGVVNNYTITIGGVTPFDHGEVDVSVYDEDGIPVLLTKLHTHPTGTFPFQFAFPAPGTYQLVMDPFPLEARPVEFGPFTAIDFTVVAADVPGLNEDAPGLAGITLLAALLLVGVAKTRLFAPKR